jgi:hypothetical protein
MTVTASTLYNLVECPQRVAIDAFGDIAKTKLSLSSGCSGNVERCSSRKRLRSQSFCWLDLSGANEVDRERLTLDAMKKGEQLIYGGA